MNRRVDVIIIGAGIMGCCAAFELAQKGYKALIIDKLPTSGGGSTSNSCGVIRTHYSTLEGVKMAYEGSSYWKNWKNYLGVEDEKGLAKFINCGLIMIKQRGYDLRETIGLYDKIGVRYEKWDLEMLKKKMPIFDLHSFWPIRRPEDKRFWDKPTEILDGAIFTPDSGYINDPQLSTHNVQRAAEAKGSEFMFNKEIVEIRRTKEQVIGVTLKNGDQIDAPVVLNAAGPHSFVINRLAGVEDGMKIKTRALRHEVHFVPSPEGFDFENDGSITSDGDVQTYQRPEVGNTILVGSEDPDCDQPIWIDNPDDFDRDVTDAQWKAQVYRLAKRIPNLQIPTKPGGFADLYDVSDDWMPIYDKTDLKGFYVAIGTSGNQFKNGPVVGCVMAELIDACEKGLDHDNDPLQFKSHYTELTLNIGFFSRLREINPDSSFSVLG